MLDLGLGGRAIHGRMCLWQLNPFALCHFKNDICVVTECNTWGDRGAAVHP